MSRQMGAGLVREMAYRRAVIFTTQPAVVHGRTKAWEITLPGFLYFLDQYFGGGNNDEQHLEHNHSSGRQMVRNG